MRLDDLVVLNPNIEGDYRHVSRAEVLEAALTEPCPDCTTQYMADCRTCEGRGWVLIDGVALQTILTSAHEERYAFVVPLSMLEGEAHESQD